MLEIDGVLWKKTGSIMSLEEYSRRMIEVLKANNIPFTMHWGKSADWEFPGLVNHMFAGKKAEWIAQLEAEGVPCGPINNLEEVFDDPQVNARNMTITLPHASAGQVRLVSNPIKLSATPVQQKLPPPLLGEHTDPILKNLLGYSEEKIFTLKTKKIISNK